MIYRIVYEKQNKTKDKFRKYRTAKSLPDAWDIAFDIASEYNSSHYIKVNPINVWKCKNKAHTEIRKKRTPLFEAQKR
ncbi:MAG: hypothetical protein WC516_09700 [Patescibacteria group bacterium]